VFSGSLEFLNTAVTFSFAGFWREKHNGRGAACGRWTWWRYHDLHGSRAEADNQTGLREILQETRAGLCDELLWSGSQNRKRAG
jgi:hypothetical protein